MQTKVCTKCGEEKPATTEYFYAQSAVCKVCYNKRSMKWQKENRERFRASAAANRKKPETRRRRNEYVKNRLKTDISFWLICRQRIRMNKILSGHVKKDSSQARQWLGCSLEQFANHLRDKFHSGMTWGNRGGVWGWQVDHIIPLSSKVSGESLFDFSSEKDCTVAFNYLNTAPIWGKDNLVKRNNPPHWDDLPPELQAICTPRIKTLLQKVEIYA